MSDLRELLRAVSPSIWQQNNRLSSAMFQPGRRDDGKLSVYDGSAISVREAIDHRAAQDRPCLGMAIVTAEECSRTDQRLICCKSPELDNPAHAHIDFTAITPRKAVESAARKLRDFAAARGMKTA